MRFSSLPPGNLTSWGSQLRAVATALRRLDSWLPTRNPFVILGLAWGLPVPFVTLGIECLIRGLPFTLPVLSGLLFENPWQWIFFAHPFLFAALFGALGTLARDRDHRIERLMNELRERADTDGLTDLFNHRAFQTRLREEMARADRENGPVALLMVDIDHFKRVNDTHGHLVGDAVLRELSSRLRAVVRPYDIVARYGGEEFTVLLPGLNVLEAFEAAERLRVAVAAEPFIVDEIRLDITVSIGLAAHGRGQSPEAWLQQADEELYRAKREGRDRTSMPPGVPVVPVPA